MVRQQISRSPLTIAVDLHSGFGLHDRVWFPYASCKKPFASLAEAYALKKLFEQCYPHHFYKIEPMSHEYVISGDLWDYLYDEFLQQADNNAVFMPLTLEMGSWLWLRKSPMHLFLRHGLFHPVLPHRQQRIMRRHLILFDFLYRAVLYPHKWTGLPPAQRLLISNKPCSFGMHKDIGRNWLLLRGLSPEIRALGRFCAVVAGSLSRARSPYAGFARYRTLS